MQITNEMFIAGENIVLRQKVFSALQFSGFNDPRNRATFTRESVAFIRCPSKRARSAIIPEFIFLLSVTAVFFSATERPRFRTVTVKKKKFRCNSMRGFQTSRDGFTFSGRVTFG
jgi:hypothetical protein